MIALEMIHRKFLANEHEEQYFIDEMMVPYKGARAGSLRQYIHSEPHKWGFKLFTRAAMSGIVYILAGQLQPGLLRI